MLLWVGQTKARQAEVCLLFGWGMPQCEFRRVWALEDVDVVENNPSCVAEHVSLSHEVLPWLGGPRQLLTWILLFSGRVGYVFRNLVMLYNKLGNWRQFLRSS